MNRAKTSLPNTARHYVLLTGATGLVGRYLLRDLLERGEKVAVLARPGKKVSAVERVENIMQMWEGVLGHEMPRPVVFEGDVAESELGLDAKSVAWITDHCDQIIHNAAILQFEGPSDGRDLMQHEPWRTNLGGTQNVLELCKLTGLSDLVYVSTAYVCGIRKEPVHEADLDCGQDFRNDYEKSKLQAEQLVRDAEWIKTKTIFRPAVIVGDSETGYTSTYHGLYLYLRLLATLVPQQRKNEDGVISTPINLPMSGDEPRNLVPVDWVSKLIACAVFRPEVKGRTYHLVPEVCSTARTVIDACYRYFNSGGVNYCGPEMDRDRNNDFAERFFDNAQVYESYETSDPQFDQANVKKFFSDLPCPVVDEEMIIRFMKFGEEDQWGKRREKPPQVKQWFADHIDGVVKDLQSLDRRTELQPLTMALDIRGRGGSQWQIAKDKNGYQVVPGIPRDPNVRLTLSAEEISGWIDADESTVNQLAIRIESAMDSAKLEV